jgi:hypothetical protein
MLNITYILARSGEDDLMKIVFGVAAVIIWGLFQLIGAVAKKAEEAKRRQRYGRLPEDVARRGGMPPLSVPPVPGQRKQNKVKGGRKTAAAPPKGAARVAPTAAAFASAAQSHATAVGARQAAAAASRPQESRRAGAAPAGQIARLLRRPESLRAALIMNEVMSKPVGLRETPRG